MTEALLYSIIEVYHRGARHTSSTQPGLCRVDSVGRLLCTHTDTSANKQGR